MSSIGVSGRCASLARLSGYFRSSDNQVIHRSHHIQGGSHVRDMQQVITVLSALPCAVVIRQQLNTLLLPMAPCTLHITINQAVSRNVLRRLLLLPSTTLLLLAVHRGGARCRARTKATTADPAAGRAGCQSISYYSRCLSVAPIVLKALLLRLNPKPSPPRPPDFSFQNHRVAGCRHASRLHPLPAAASTRHTAQRCPVGRLRWLTVVPHSQQTKPLMLPAARLADALLSAPTLGQQIGGCDANSRSAALTWAAPPPSRPRDGGNVVALRRHLCEGKGRRRIYELNPQQEICRDVIETQQQALRRRWRREEMAETSHRGEGCLEGGS